MNFIDLVGGVGFMGASLIVLAAYVDRKDKQNREDTQKMIDMLREDAKEDKERLMDEVNYNRDVIVKVVATSDVLAKDLTVKVDKILDKVGV